MGVRDFVAVIREISFDDLEMEARIAPRILVVSEQQQVAAQLASAIFGTSSEEFVDVRTFANGDVDPLKYDVIVTSGPLQPETARAWRNLYRRVEEPMRLVECQTSALGNQDQIESLRRRIADRADDRVLAIGRYVPQMTSACAQQVISETSTVNGEFAFVSNIPTLVPIVGSALAVGADFVVLTKNQLMLLFKLAAINGRDLENRWRIYAEMFPVVGAGLGWRTVAREVACLMPLALGTMPKVAIAFAGTWVIGQTAQVYFERGQRLNRSEIRTLYDQALVTLRDHPIRTPRLRVLRRGEPSTDGTINEEKKPA